MNHDNDNNAALRFLSVCSGIEAASVAWRSLNWQAVAFSEIEKFPSAVLKHHYPDVPNLGDFTKIDARRLGRVDILCGGTPCQAFSVAGLRQSLADARGNLSLEFVRLAHELADGNGLRNVVWENVVGVLSTKDNAFGCFLAGLVGADAAIEPPARGKWPRHGMVSGPKGRAAWAVKDAQFFGVAQRRRRVLVVADFGNGADPAAVLFEPEGVFRHSPPSREAGKDVAPTISARTKGGGGLGTDFDLDGGLVEAAHPLLAKGNSSHDATKETYIPEIARCVATREGSSQDFETTTMVAVEVAPTMRAGGNKTGGDRPYGTDVDTCDSLAVVHAIQAGALRTNPDSGPDGLGIQADIAYTLEARAEVQAVCVTGNVTHTLKAEGADASEAGTGRGTPIVAFDTTQITSKLNRSVPKAGDPCHPLSAGAHPPAICFSAKDYGADASFELSPTLRSGNHSESHQNGGVMPAIAFAHQAGGDGTSSGAFSEEMSPTLQKSQTMAVLTSAVRRLTPKECERLQGFPDDYTAIPWRGKPAGQCPDGPRYKALGNSWAVPKFTWLGERIQMLMPNEKPAAANNNDNDGVRDEKAAA
ncbi:DNA cytosine methyltransferase [Rhizobium laguerreae]|uniref:DNA cytosine methyltransferase n=1 Tax=Rhizobium laguerreae TaxID=1076926 RepID=UPI001C9296E8|nr:DNA cytosine methyltransferase [Rhizobium laguerreae]